MKNKAFNLIDVEFSYNGNLGTLQQKTIDNKIFCNRLLQNEVITYEEYKEILKAICDYFEKQADSGKSDQPQNKQTAQKSPM